MTNRFAHPKIKTEVLTANYPIKVPDQARKATQKPS
jgi:hypothetical protein